MIKSFQFFLILVLFCCVGIKQISCEDSKIHYEIIMHQSYHNKPYICKSQLKVICGDNPYDNISKPIQDTTLKSDEYCCFEGYCIEDESKVLRCELGKIKKSFELCNKNPLSVCGKSGNQSCTKDNPSLIGLT